MLGSCCDNYFNSNHVLIAYVEDSIAQNNSALILREENLTERYHFTSVQHIYTRYTPQLFTVKTESRGLK